MNVRFYLRRPNDNRPSVIYARITHNKIQYKYYLIEKIHPSDWNPKTQRAVAGTEYGKGMEFNQRLKNISMNISDAFYRFQNTNQGIAPTPQEFNLVLDEVFNKQTKARIDRQTQRSFWGFFQNLIDRMESGTRVHIQKNTPLATSTIKNMRNLMNHLRDYQQYSHNDVEFDTIDMDFYYDFTGYLTKVKKAGINTIGKQITQLKVVLREALEMGYTSNIVFTHRRFRSAVVETDAVYLNDQEIEAIYNLDLSDDKKLERVRDLFIVGCYIGQRFSDLSQLSVDKIEDGIIEVHQVKTGERVYIPLQPEVKNIMKRYNGGFPPAISNQKFNEYLKHVAEKCELLKKEVSLRFFSAGKRVLLTKPKFEFVKSHTARRSFATNEYLKGELTIVEIRAITGHKTDKAFYRYIRSTPRENANNVAAKWKQREARKLRLATGNSILRAI